MSLGQDFGNPFLTPSRLRQASGTGTMTVAGTATKLLVLLLVLGLTAAYTWNEAYKAWDNFDFSSLKSVTEKVDGKDKSRTVVVEREVETGKEVYKDPPKFDTGKVSTLMWIGVIGGFILGLICACSPRAAVFLAIPYAALEGLALGGISATFEVQYGGIVMQALASTFGVLLVMLCLYALRILRATGPFVTGLLALMLGVLLIYIVDMLLRAFGGGGVSIVHSNSVWGIGFSVFVCALAAFNFIVDFATIEEGVESNAPKYMEWYSAWGVLVTLIWLYIEILRLLAKVKSKK